MSRWMSAGLILAAAVGLSGCLGLECLGRCSSHAHNSSSLVEFLYPGGGAPTRDAMPRLQIPLRVGLAFLPANGGDPTGGLEAAQRQELLELIKQHFADRRFVAEIVLIPDYYLSNRRGFAGLEGIQRLYGVDVMALVSYDQVTHLDENNWSLGYLTIVGAYVLKGSRHDVSTLVDLAVVDPATRALVLRAGGTDTRHVIEHFDAALEKFEADVRSGKAAVQVVHKNEPARSGGGGAFGWPSLLALLMLVTVSRLWRIPE